jgi:hypothetical protein
VKNLLKFTALTVFLGLFVFGCIQTDKPEPISGVSTALIYDAPAAPIPRTETLGTPDELTVGSGTGVMVAGVGMRGSTTGTISITVPHPVVQALLYWEGYETSATGDDQITVNSSGITGTLLGGPTLFFTDSWTSTYRADITSMVSQGSNTLNIADMTNDRNNGVGVLVIYDDGSDKAQIGLVDGSDCAYWDFGSPLDTTVPQTFTFDAASSDRTAQLVTFASSIGGADVRCNQVTLSFDGGAPITVNNPFDDSDGLKFDSFSADITIPAGATSLTVQGLSAGACDNPASFVWLAAALAVVPEMGGDSCTPGYWKNIRMHGCEWAAAGYSPTDDFDTVFGTDWFSPNKTLHQALSAKNSEGGGCGQTARHGTAALLNAANPDVNYPMTVTEVINAVRSCSAKVMADYNEDLPCYLNNCKDESIDTVQ